MQAAAKWVLLRAGLYAALALIVATIGGFVYSAATGADVLAGSNRSLDNLRAWFHVGFGSAILGGCLTLVLLGILAPFRGRLSSVQLKLTLLPFLLFPVVIVDLAGASPSFTLGLLAIQCLYLKIMPVRRLSAKPGPRASDAAG